MVDSKELKPKSFRIEDETAEKFKEISSKFSNQQEAFAKLIETYEFQLGKSVLTEKRPDIEQFEKYVNVLTRMFMASLEDNQNITQTVRTEFDALLKSKDVTIQDLQEKLTAAKQIKEEATTRAKTYADENASLNATINSITKEYNAKTDNLQSMLEDKDKLNRALTDACTDLKQKVDDLTTEHEELKALKREYDSITIKCKEYEKDKVDLQNQIERDRKEYEKDKENLQNQMDRDSKEHKKVVADLKQHEVDALERLKAQSQLAMDKAILEVEKKHQDQLEKLKGEIEKLKEQKQNEIDKYQQKYLELLEQMKISAEDKTKIKEKL